MAEKPTVLIQLDTDAQPSSFDAIVAVDSGVQHLVSYGSIRAPMVMPLVHGCIFTRGTTDLKNTAIFIGGSEVHLGELVLAEVKKHLLPGFGLSVSVMLDSNGSNTTAAAAVRAAARHLDLSRTSSLVLGGTGPVGQRVARLLAKLGGHVRIGSRQLDRAKAVCESIAVAVPRAKVEAVSTASSSDAPLALEGRQLVVAAGAPGTLLLPNKHWMASQSLQVAIDLNGVPPAGIEDIELIDKATNREDVLCYGALGIGGTKMKVHKAAIQELFSRNNAVLDIDAIYDIACGID